MQEKLRQKKYIIYEELRHIESMLKRCLSSMEVESREPSEIIRILKPMITKEN